MTIQPETPSHFCIRLSHDEFEGGELQVIEGAFRQIYVAANGPVGMALLLHREPGQDGCRVYLTASSLPHAAVLVKAYSALPEALPAQGLRVLAGDDSVGGYSKVF
jgi:hypothetical protein